MSRLTFAELDAVALRQAALTDNSLDPALRRELINAALDTLWEEFKADPFYRQSALLVIAPDVEHLAGGTLPNLGTFLGLNATAHTMIRGTGSFTAGSLMVFTKWRTSTSLITSQFLGRVLVSGLVSSYELIAGSEESFNAGGLDQAAVTLIRGLSTKSAAFDPLNFDRIVTVRDDAARPTQVSFDPIADRREFDDLALYRRKGSRVAYYHRASAIDFFVPAGAPALAQVSVEYVGRPNRYTLQTAAEEVLIPPQRIAALIAAVAAAFSSGTTQGGPKAT